MARQVPKNVRQIGNVSDSSKIYIEDYVETFLNQICETASENMLGAFLVGEKVQEEENDYIYVCGAIHMHKLEVKGNDIIIEETVWKDACETCKEYFGDAEILGWFAAGGEKPLEPNHNISKIHQTYFPREQSIFISKSYREKEEKYYIYKLGEMIECQGHYIYYERNADMQNYMVSTRKETGLTPSEVIEDRAAKSFRNIVQEKLKQTEQKNHSRLVYGMSTFFAVVALAIGATYLNNYEKMKNAEQTLGEIVKNDYVQDDNSVEVENPDTEVSLELQGNVTDETETPEEPEVPEEVEDEPVSGIHMEEIYIVEKGDTLASISKKVYGSITYIEEICELNGLEDGNLIFIGQKLLLP